MRLVRKTSLVAGGLLCSLFSLARAGDAVAVGYNAEGIWTTVTYYCSSTPKGGSDYKIAAQARAAALLDLRRRGKEALARESVLAESDSTGYIAVARGKTKSEKGVIVVGRGKSQADADKEALDKLARAEAGVDQKIFYRFHSYGADS